MIIDDLSVARVTPLVSGNFWANSTFELGSNLDQSDGTPANWNRGGSDGSIDQVTTNSFKEPHPCPGGRGSSDSGYGEWYSRLWRPRQLATCWMSVVEIYGITNGQMRVTVGFRTADDAFISKPPSSFLAIVPVGSAPSRALPS
jgi:hypothetical protein